jgi:predicted nucleic acid-binding protein
VATIVIDANLALGLVVALPYSDSAEAHIAAWRNKQFVLAVPALWWYEVSSGLRKAVNAKYLNSDDALSALDILQNLALKTYEPTVALQRRSLAWAERLKQSVTYDAQYVALAEQLDSPLWTADKKLVTSAHAAKATWVQLLPTRLEDTFELPGGKA